MIPWITCVVALALGSESPGPPPSETPPTDIGEVSASPPAVTPAPN